MNNSFQSVIDTFDVFLSSIRDTIVMSLISLVIAGIIGLALGLLLYATRPGNLLGNRVAYTVINVVVNLVRPIPFVIFLAAIAPLSRVVVQTTIGVPAVTFAISLAAAFAVSRIVEQNLLAIDPGVVEAARASGAHPVSILLTVLIPEGLGPLILGYTFIYIGIVDMTAQGALVGGGGLGEYAITYGSQRYDWWIVYVSVAAIVVIVQLGQFIGNRLARATLRR
ncbi:D-methionine transport system permease protein [Curtobacterium sp. 314Chir4.1]|uniref:methionine ABC transporter permease n=1 Tax=Curtobacterium sp. 314Chir4.1 TaxID=1279028 RepID=UPI0009A20D16|nr:ABC transporter permease subunit [Curtobacterium sp. 314Chir4.1]SOC87661.1 D-methionine transport system permease protein [Curtobacterium sp. 314Chir4.1]